MGGEGGEGGALAEGRRCPCEACGSAAAAGGALTWHCARVSSRHVGRGRCALRLGRAGAGGRSLRAGHRAGGEGDGKAEKWKSGKAKAAKRGAASSISFASASPLSHRTPPTMAYVAVAKALYDYQPQDPDTELAFNEDHILYIIDKEDDE